MLIVKGFSQKTSDNVDTLCQKKLTGMVMAITDITFTKQNVYTSCGIGGALRFNDRFYIGIYGLGLMTNLKSSDFNNLKSSANYQLSFSQGGLSMGYINSNIRKVLLSFSLKTGYGAVFMYNPQYVIDYTIARDEFLIVTPSFDAEFFIANWLKLNIGCGIRFIHGFSTRYFDQNGVKTLYYKSSALEGVNLSFSLFFGSFCKFKK